MRRVETRHLGRSRHPRRQRLLQRAHLQPLARPTGGQQRLGRGARPARRVHAILVERVGRGRIGPEARQDGAGVKVGRQIGRQTGDEGHHARLQGANKLLRQLWFVEGQRCAVRIG